MVEKLQKQDFLGEYNDVEKTKVATAIFTQTCIQSNDTACWDVEGP